jgi:hypothetical protein
VGYVLLRPVLREYEIAYLAKPAVTKEFQIKLTDLMVSVKGNTVMLRSKRLNKWIIPHLTNAHNFSFNALPIYQFLADLQTQGLRSAVGFNWGSFANEYPFLPRVKYRNLIFSPATWNIRKEDIQSLLKIKDDKELLEAMKKWRQKLKMPAHVLLADNDNKLFINLDNILCIKTLFSVTKNRGNFQLMESLYEFGPNLDQGVVKNSSGVFTNEFVFCFYNSAKNQPDNQSATAEKNGKKES